MKRTYPYEAMYPNKKISIQKQDNYIYAFAFICTITLYVIYKIHTLM
jgi:hypothetical protein